MRVRVCQRQGEARRVCQEQESVMCRGNDVEEMRNGGKHDRAGEKKSSLPSHLCFIFKRGY